MAGVTIEQAIEMAMQRQGAGDARGAEEICRGILRVDAQNATALHLLGIALAQQGRKVEGVDALRAAMAVSSSPAAICCDLGVMLHDLGRYAEAEAAYREAIRLEPRMEEAHNNLGNTLVRLNRAIEAIASFEAALKIREAYAEAHVNLAAALSRETRLEDAERHLRRAVELCADYAEAWTTLGAVLKEQGKIDEAERAMRRAVEIRPEVSELWSNLLLTMHYREGCRPAELLEAHRRWEEQCVRKVAGEARPAFANEPDPERRLRIGYVSSDFWNHPVGRFLLPLLRERDRERFEAECFYSDEIEDGMTAKLKAAADAWHAVAGMDHAAMAEMIRARRIDVLVDLSAHTAGNRMMVFARRPAPVQVTYLAYPGTTGLSAIDYRITDAWLEAEGDERTVETPVRVTSYWCYAPLEDLPEVGELPAAANGYLTFGCLNRFFKVNDGALSAWAEILKRLPTARLIMHAQSEGERQRVREFLPADRVEFIEHLKRREYFEAYGRIDISLDPFPFNGGTTTCDSLWMGVPVVSLAGDWPVRRAGRSLMNQIRLGELVAESSGQYVDIAVNLASDSERLAELRRGLRDRMKRSPLCDAKAAARELENANRTIWRAWCTGQRQI